MAMTMVSESVLLTAVDRVERRQESRWINSRMGLNQEWNRTHPIYSTGHISYFLDILNLITFADIHDNERHIGKGRGFKYHQLIHYHIL